MFTYQKKLSLQDFDYPLPQQNIAYFPRENRLKKKLLVYRNQDIEDTHFTTLPERIPPDTLLLCNDTRVFSARIFFQQPKSIELLLVSPQHPEKNWMDHFSVKGSCSWICKIKNAKKWKEIVLQKTIHIYGNPILVSAHLHDRKQGVVYFSWTPIDFSWGQIVEAMGEMPLPPYIKRPTIEKDKLYYQTIFSKNTGAIAAPTASLHFDKELKREMENRGHKFATLTLHVGLGTFSPIYHTDIVSHEMHRERVKFSKPFIELLLKKEKKIAVGTTVLRALESLYWYGVKLIMGDKKEGFSISQYEPHNYLHRELPSQEAVIEVLLEKMEKEGIADLYGETSLFILPGYKFHFSHACITNFHLPKSTLLLLIEAFIGKDWRKIYTYALKKNYQFLSYGDATLLFRN